MCGGGELIHVGADFSQNLFRTPASNAGNCVQPLQVFFKRGHSFLDFGIDLFDEFVQIIDVAKLRFKHQALVRANEPVQSFLQVRLFSFEFSLRQFRQDSRVCLALNNRFDHESTGFAQDIGSDGRQFDVGALQYFLNALNLPGAFINQAAAVANESAQLALLTAWNVAALDQTMVQQTGNPFGVFHIGFTTGHILDVPGVDDKGFDLFHLQQIVNGLSKRARAFHGDMRTAMRLDPIDEGKQILGHRGEGSDLFVIRGDDAAYHVLLVNVESTDVRVNDVHTKTLLAA